jgi:DNA-binding IscR family transcriptional regulator
MYALEDRASLLECLKKNALCKRAGDCRARKFWARLDKAIKEILADTTLKDLSKGAKPTGKADNIGHRYVFEI